MIYVSGCIGMDRETKQLVSEEVAVQARKCLENMKCIVEDAGSDMSKVVKCTVLLVDMADFAAINAVYAEFFDAATAPARACFAVRALPAGSKIEIDAICIA